MAHIVSDPFPPMPDPGPQPPALEPSGGNGVAVNATAPVTANSEVSSQTAGSPPKREVLGISVSSRPKLLLSLHVGALRALTSKGLSAGVTCATVCKASGRLQRGGRTIAKAAPVQAHAGRQAVLKLKAIKSQRPLLRRLKKAKFVLRITTVDDAGRTSAILKTVTLR